MIKSKQWLYTAHGDLDIKTGLPFKISFVVQGFNKKEARRLGYVIAKSTFRQVKQDIVEEMKI